ILDAAAPHGGQLVDHQVTVVRQTSETASRNPQPQQRCIDQRSGRWDDSHRLREFEDVILDDDRRTRFGGVDTTRHGPQLTAPHSSSHATETASMKSWSSPWRSSCATRAAWRRASRANCSERTSGTHTCTGRYPRASMRARYFLTLS